MKDNNSFSGGRDIQDLDIIYLSSRIDSLEKNQMEIIEIIKQTLSYAAHPGMQALIKKIPNERRSQQRRQINVPISYEYSFDHNTISRSGKSFNISKSGMCFFTQVSLKEGLTLRVHNEYIWDSPKTVIVKWCHRKYLNFYQVGVSFQ